LTNLPFQNESVDVLLNIFSPSAYKEFNRVLTNDGVLIKVVPDEFYLKELRQAFFADNESKQSYSNENVVKKFEESMNLVNNERITYTFAIPEHLQRDILLMSPLEWNASAEKIDELVGTITEVTIDLRLLIGTRKDA
jgi:23S rRNA (guanine745-N1)-methyltransferase